MADQKASALAELSVPVRTDYAYAVLASGPTSKYLTLGRMGGLLARPAAGGRLTLTTAVPVTVSDVTGAATLYYTPDPLSPWCGLVSLFDGTRWALYPFTEISLTLTALLTSGKPHDVWLYDNSGTLTLEVLAWTSDTARATALALQDGLYLKTGALTRRYLGTIYATGTGTTEDSLLKRYVWNAYNRRLRPLQVFDGTDTWTYAVTAWRQARGQAANQVDYVCGVDGDLVAAESRATAEGGSGVAGAVGVGIDSTTANSAQLVNDVSAGVNSGSWIAQARYRGFPGIGRHSLVWLEYRRAGTITFGGDEGTADQQSGLVAEVLA